RRHGHRRRRAAEPGHDGPRGRPHAVPRHGLERERRPVRRRGVGDGDAPRRHRLRDDLRPPRRRPRRRRRAHADADGARAGDGADDSDAFTFTKEAGALAGTPAGGEPTTAAWTVTEDAETAGAGTVDAASATPDGPAAALTLVGTAPNPVRGAAVVRYAVGAA